MHAAPSHWFQAGMLPRATIWTMKLKTMLMERVMVTREGVSSLRAAWERNRNVQVTIKEMERTDVYPY